MTATSPTFQDQPCRPTNFALFQVNGTGAFHVFISVGVAGVGPNDVLVQLSNITAISTIDLTGGDLSILT